MPLRFTFFAQTRPTSISSPHAVTGYTIGGGIAGLTAAIALRQGGLAVQVCETALQILPVGAGIRMALNAERTELLGLLQGAFRDFAYPGPAILAAVNEPAIIKNEVIDISPLPRWHQGRICLIGDAAHPTIHGPGRLPGRGRCLCAGPLSASTPTTQPPPLAQRLRRAKGHRIVRTSRLMGHVGYLDGAAGALCNFAMRAAPM